MIATTATPSSISIEAVKVRFGRHLQFNLYEDALTNLSTYVSFVGGL